MPSPTRSPTHEDVPPATLAKLGLDLDDAAEAAGGPLEHEALVELAAERGKPVSQYYAAAVLATDVELARHHELTLVFCAGTCQRWGALDCIDRAAERKEAGAPIDLAVRTCLDRCEHAAVCEVRTPDGTTIVTEATPAKIDAAIDTLLH
jgi:hypothetical protein